jgi:hypothetical protein
MSFDGTKHVPSKAACLSTDKAELHHSVRIDFEFRHRNPYLYRDGKDLSLESDMKKIILAAAVLASFAGAAYAETDGEYIMKDDAAATSSNANENRDVVTEPFAAPSRISGCDEAAGGAARLDACSPDGQASGGGNSGGQSR